MHIAIDMRPALSHGTGVGTFIEQLALALDRQEGDHHISLFSSSRKERWPDNRLPALRRSRVVDRRWPVRLLNTLWHRAGWPPVDRFVGRTDIAHSPTPLIMPCRGRRIITLHDLYFLTNPEDTVREIRRDYVGLVRRHARTADAIIAVSRATARAAEEYLQLPPEKLHVCLEDAAPIYDQPPTDHDLEQIDALIGRPFVLFVGTLEPRKNLPPLVRAFEILNARYPQLMLVVAGARGWGVNSGDVGLERLRQRGAAWLGGYRDQRFLRALYHRARCLVMPSKCEGFGLPLVEAMACGCPLVVADNSALPEVAGDAALYWRGGDEEQLAGLIERLLEDGEERRSLIARGAARRREFSWDRTAATVLAVYRALGR